MDYSSYSGCIAWTTFGDVAVRSLSPNAFWLILKRWFSECTYVFGIFKMYNTGWAKSRRALDCFFIFMAEILGGYWQILDRSGKKIVLLSPQVKTRGNGVPAPFLMWKPVAHTSKVTWRFRFFISISTCSAWSNINEEMTSHVVYRRASQSMSRDHKWVAKCNFGPAKKLVEQIRCTSVCKVYKKTLK